MARPTKTDNLNWILRYLAANAVQSLVWPTGSADRNYSDNWIMSKSLEVFQ